MRVLRLATLALVALAGLALAGNALATQQISVSQTPSALTIKISQSQTDPQPAKITVYVPSGYQLNPTQPAGTKIGTTSGHLFARDLNVSVPLEGDVVADDPAKHAADPCSPGSHLAVWILQLTVVGNSFNLPVYVSQTSGAETARGAAKLELCLGPTDVAQGTPGRSPSGAQLLDATFTMNGVVTPPAGASRWISLWTPYATGSPLPNVAGTVEARSFVGPGAATIAFKVLSRRKKLVQITGKLTQAGLGVTGAKVSLLLNSRARFSARTRSNGSYFFKLQNTATRVVTTLFQAKATVAGRDVTTTGCANPTVAGTRCVSATAGGFTAVSRRIKIRL
jgi:hypothetical protein